MPSGEETMAKARRVLSTRVPDRCSFCGLTPVSKHEGVRLVVASEDAAICNPLRRRGRGRTRGASR
jgi:hypothetical protein